MIRPVIDQNALAQIFSEARTYNGWADRPVGDDVLRRIYELTSFGPTAANSSPARFVFIRSAEGKERLRPHINPGNIDKTMSAPCCVIVTCDTRFYEYMPQLFPARDFKSVFEGNPASASETARRSTTLEGAYMIMAARALGLDAGPMSGFNAETLNAEFFPDGRWQADFLCNLGYGLAESLHSRNPRLDFDQACRLL